MIARFIVFLLLMIAFGCRKESVDQSKFLADTLSNKAVELQDRGKRSDVWRKLVFCDSSAIWLYEYYSSTVVEDSATRAAFYDSSLIVSRVQIAAGCRNSIVKGSVGQLFRAGDTLFALSAMSLLLNDSVNAVDLGKWLRNPRIMALLKVQSHKSPQ